MLKDWKHIDLSKATIFDLTDDIALIRKAECRSLDEEILDRLTYESKYSRLYIVSSMLSYAYIIDDKELCEAIKKANPNDLVVYDE